MLQMIVPLALLLLGGASAKAVPSFLAENPLTQNQLDVVAAMTSSAFEKQRKLAYTIDFVPGADPAFVCQSFQDASEGQYECNCDYAPDKSVRLKCIDIKGTCNEGETFCFKQNINMGLTTDNVIKEIETCTQYDTNLTEFEGTGTVYANYSQIIPCVKVIPKTVGDFSSLDSCEASINELPCYKCEIRQCEIDEELVLGISMDCCNTNPNGEPLKVACGPMGGGGAFAPQFDPYQEGEEGKCSGARDVGGGFFILTASLAALVSMVI